MLNLVMYRFRNEKESVVKRKSLMRICLCVVVLFFSAVVFAAPVPDVGQTTDHPIHSDASSPIALIGSGLNPADRLIASTNEVVPLIGAGVAGNMLQFKAGGHVLGFRPNKAYLAGLDHVLSVEFLETPGVMPTAASTAPATGNMIKVPALSTVRYQNLWDNISLTYESTKDGITESTYHVAPGGDVSKIRLRYNVPVESQVDGSLKFKFDSGHLIESSPVAWQKIGEKQVPVTVAFRVSSGEVGFSVGQYDRSYPLIIDPTYVWQTYYWPSMGWSNNYSIAIDGSGNVYVSGDSQATWNGPTGQIPLNAHSGGPGDIFVLKLDSNGAYKWHTFYGSSSYINFAYDIAVDVSSNVYVTGRGAGSWNSPTGQSPLNAHSGSFNGNGSSVFVLKLDRNGTYLWHTFYGSSAFGGGVALDNSGNVYVTGWSFQTWGSPQYPFSGFGDVFVLKLNSSGTYLWHTFYGSGGNYEIGYGIAVDGIGNVYLTGRSQATWNSPTGKIPLNAYSGNSSYIYDIFVLKLDSSGTYLWHTFYGPGSNDYGGRCIAVDGSGNVYTMGHSSVTWNGPAGQIPLNAHSDPAGTFVLKLDSNGAYKWHSFYGSSSEHSNGIAVDSSSNVYFLTEYVVKLNSSGVHKWSISPKDCNHAHAIAVDGNGNVFVAGENTVLKIDGSPCNLQISQSPNAGAVGTEFSLTGNRFTPNSTATIYFSNPYVFPNMCVSIDRNGKFSNSPYFTVPANTPNGFYMWWAVDGITGCESEHLPFTIDTTTISSGNYVVTNSRTVSNQFELWLDVSINNQKPGENFCNDYQIEIKDCDDIPSNVSITPGKLERMSDGKLNNENSIRYRQFFQLVGSSGSQPAYFVNGKVHITSKTTPSQSHVLGLKEFSVYGTNFDITKHAWKFKNGSWEYAIPLSNIWRAADVIDDYIAPGYQRDHFWHSVGGPTAMKSITEWDSNPLKDFLSSGLCYGLTNTAIANFKHSGEAWGTGSGWEIFWASDYWKAEIDKHWHSEQAVSPFKPIISNEIYGLEWDFDSAKKIIYYSCGQYFYGPKNGWVAADGAVKITSSNSTKLIDVLKNGTPVSISFQKKDSAHAVAATQLINYNNIKSYTIWDNKQPYIYPGILSFLSPLDGYEPYRRWYVQNGNYSGEQIIYKIMNSSLGISSPYGIPISADTFIDNDFSPMYLPTEIEGDPQNIYGFRTTSSQQRVSKASLEPFVTSTNPLLSSTIVVSIIGGQVTGTTNKATTTPIMLVPNGDVSTGQAVITTTLGGSYNLLQLPVDITYRIDAVKLTDVPFLKVFVRIPLPDGTLEVLNYEAVETGETDATQVYFYVGVGNTDKVIRRTAAPATARMQVQAAAGDYPPDFDQTLPTQINPPGNLRAFVENSVVQLAWVNTIHPNLSAVKIVRTTGTYPTSPDDGVTVYDALGTSAQDNTVSMGTLYFYAAYSRDTSGAYSEPVYAGVNTYLYSIYGKVALSTSEGVSGASAVLVDGVGKTVGMATSGSDGNYLFSNLEMDAYTLTVSHPSHTIDNPQRSISIEGQNIEENFTAVPVPTLQLLFNPSFVNIGSTVSVPWAYRTIANTETVKIELYRGGVWQTLAASVPILTGNIQWNVTGPADAQAKIRISLNANPSLTNENTFSIVDPNAIGLTGPGWNLISLPLQPSNTAITNVLGSISGKYTSTWAYQNDSWKVFDPASPGLSDLSILETGWGYWLDMTEAATLSVTGTEPSKTINLITGWNLVGYNSSTSQNIADALASIAGKVVSVWAYKNDSWEFYDPANPGLSDLTTMSPGYGYWINTNGVCTWTLP
jgi:hypothetical protein